MAEVLAIETTNLTADLLAGVEEAQRNGKDSHYLQN